MTDQEIFEKLPLEAEKAGLVKKIKTGKKSSFWYHALFNFLLNLVYPKDRKDSYLERYWTTIGYSIAWPDKYGDRPEQWQTMAHELKHAQQAKKWSRPLFSYLYLWPMSQGALLILLGWVPLFWVPGFWKILYVALWLIISGAHFIPQLPDPWRKHWELQAYTISMYFHIQQYGRLEGWYKTSIVENFCSMAYFMMATSREKMTKEVVRIAREIMLGEHKVKDEPIVKIVEKLKNG